ncbi:FtsX-like permease family protein [Zavarzinella formosa]|uniref:FtsX-like permease family protein n=1 Tax=Zavarzinella formosa TaxID=360055 RepID=UPI0002EB2932|nr:ABC transporter permease [Zavarzinella formosa]
MTLSEFKVSLRLVASHMRKRPGRFLLTSLSTIAASCIVVWVVSGYDSLVGQFGGMGEEYVGRYDLLLVPARNREAVSAAPAGPGGFGRAPQLTKELVEQIRQDPAVAVIDPVFETALRATKIGETNAPRLPVPGAGGEEEGPAAAPVPGPAAPASKTPATPKEPESGPRMMGGVAQQRSQSKIPTVVGTDSTEPIHSVVHGQWFNPKDGAQMVGALTRESAEQMEISVGDELVVGSGFGQGRTETKIKIVAIVEQSKRLPGPRFMVGLPPTQPGALPGGPAANALYVPVATAEKLAAIPARTSYAGVILKPGENIEAFQSRWAEAFGSASTPVEVRTPAKVDQEVDNSTTFNTVRAQAYSATGISLLAALFIIFTTLSMGVDERIRQFAMLRAVALTKLQIALMVATESLVLGLIGWGGGLLAGMALLKIMARIKPQLLSEGADLGWWCVALSGVCALGGSMAASVMPAWRATSVSPLEAMVPRQRSGSGRPPWVLTIIGLVFIAINPLVVFYVPMPDTSRYMAAAAIGSTTMIVGFIMLTPMAVVLTERIVGPVLAKLLFLNTRLLATQLSANMWRTVGTTVAMTIGLGLFVATQTWGYSMLAAFTPGEWAPDLVISVPSGASDEQVEKLRHIPGLVADKFAPLAVKHVKFTDDPTGSKIRESATRQDSCVMIGLDPDAAFGGDKPLFKFEFVEGKRDEAIAKLKQGRFCLVPDHFARESGLGIGGKFGVFSGGRTGDRVDYEIAGVVSMPGWHWLTKSGFRQGRAAGLMFCESQTVKHDFNITRTTTFWVNMDGSSSEEDIKTAVQEIVARPKSDAPNPAEGANAGKSPNPAGGRRGRGPVPGGAAPGGAGPGGGGFGGRVTLTSAEFARKEIRGRADNIIWALSELPLVTLLVTSLGVMNTVLSSVRARRWDMGVMRALGVTRFGLFRLIIAESLLIGLVACLLSLGFGAMAGYCGTGVTRYVNIRGGQYTPVILPWAKLWIGFGIAVGLCLVTALWPAFRAGRTDPLRLLQEGRSAA